VIHAVPGIECNIYFDNVILAPNIGNYLFDVTCAKGRQQADRYTWTPTEEDLGNHSLTLKVYNADYVVVAEGTTEVRVVSPRMAADRNLTYLIIGDSLTAASVYPAELNRLFSQEGQPRVTLIGTTDRGEGVRHEGYGGWAAATFVSRWAAAVDPENPHRQRSPFLYLVDEKPVLEFARYCEENNRGAAPDYITIALGCNDNFSATEETIEESIDRFLANMDVLLAEFRRVGPDTKIGIVLLVPPSASQDAFGANYGCGQTRYQYRRNQHRVVERLMEAYGNRAAENVFLIPAHVNLDCVHNYPTATGPANARTETELTRASNGVHPAATGYRQMADSIYCWMVGSLAESP
jgi:lysophospholipase L1-like esterase